MGVFQYGEEIQSNEDVRNLVINLIFRQEEPYTIETIVNQTQEGLQDSPLSVSDYDLENLVRDSLEVLMLSGNDITCYNGVYTPASAIF